MAEQIARVNDNAYETTARETRVQFNQGSKSAQAKPRSPEKTKGRRHRVHQELPKQDPKQKPEPNYNVYSQPRINTQSVQIEPQQASQKQKFLTHNNLFNLLAADE